MGTSERRLQILKYLCKKRRATMTQLAEEFGVSLRTIQRDILQIETTLRAPLEIRYGKYAGGVYVMGDYTFDRIYMHNDELSLLAKIEDITKAELSDKESALLSRIIKNYTKIF